MPLQPRIQAVIEYTPIPKPIQPTRYKTLFRVVSSIQWIVPARTPVTRSMSVAAAKEDRISFLSSWLNQPGPVSRVKYLARMIRFTPDAREVAKASPANPMGPMSRRFKTILTTRATPAAKNGIRVFSRAKKPRPRILMPMNSGRPIE